MALLSEREKEHKRSEFRIGNVSMLIELFSLVPQHVSAQTETNLNMNSSQKMNSYSIKL